MNSIKHYLKSIRDTLTFRMTYDRLEFMVNKWTKIHGAEIVSTAWNQLRLAQRQGREVPVVESTILRPVRACCPDRNVRH